MRSWKRSLVCSRKVVQHIYRSWHFLIFSIFQLRFQSSITGQCIIVHRKLRSTRSLRHAILFIQGRGRITRSSLWIFFGLVLVYDLGRNEVQNGIHDITLTWIAFRVVSFEVFFLMLSDNLFLVQSTVRLIHWFDRLWGRLVSRLIDRLLDWLAYSFDRSIDWLIDWLTEIRQGSIDCLIGYFVFGC